MVGQPEAQTILTIHKGLHRKMYALKAGFALAICIAVVTFVAAMKATDGRPTGPDWADQATYRTSVALAAVVLLPLFGLHVAAVLA